MDYNAEITRATDVPTASPPPSAQRPSPPLPTPPVPMPPAPLPLAAPALHTWTVAEFEGGIASGFIEESDAVELLEGQITEKMATNSPHAYATNTMLEILHANLSGKGYAIGGQSPVQLSEISRPEPDVHVARGPSRQYIKRVPDADDVLWLAEVADSSINIDRDFKLGIYARAGIPEYWIIDLTNSRIECNTEPQPDGTYATKRTYKMGETIKHDLLGEITLTDLFADEVEETTP